MHKDNQYLEQREITLSNMAQYKMTCDHNDENFFLEKNYVQ